MTQSNVLTKEALLELRDWLLNGAPCVTGGCYAAGGVRQADMFKLFAHIDEQAVELDQMRSIHAAEVAPHLERLMEMKLAKPGANVLAAAIDHIERLRKALARLASSEAFLVSRSIDQERDAELLARMRYAEQSLLSSAHAAQDANEGEKNG